MTDAVEPIPSVESVTGTGIPIRGDDIDTDQILPSRFMKVVTFEGLGEFSFFDKRFDRDDNPKDHPMNEDRFRDASVMVVNGNFGCGSSREHAPQALLRWGIDAIIGESFAEIFSGNCLALGIPTVTADAKTIDHLQEWVKGHPREEITVDVADRTVSYGEHTATVTVDDVQHEALVDGTWDMTALLRSDSDAIERTVAQLPYVPQR
ncbi:3-isopropylmalate dehydratase small subunit [Natranaeroarchaeum aerophilus]|uniref:3-isopropylmalate dehydratase n=1 Tax=Natranaeroarchaeum aerophilus TaxID=2917711 RepID=A0AAE3FTS7_9EURY|nr:3-isopropylmalate dehydratase small subunit [Natranaeroarchaeum aerophilus]MCL9815001.1 3-isopropylmalate dehydratase small subunit [Natranaeroarchaeum aerophilus]